ncbi:MAG: glutathione S-transferase N-terminal domain-containing protein [Sulfuricella sp.]|nr:glutathione S-transferase N-terminal domain-containing protein [Sulfuricella sp.]
MKLILTLTSPFARKVRIVMSEKKIEYDTQEENPWIPDTRVTEFNPLGKVPVLVLDDGGTVFDSPVIVEYLDMVSPVHRLIPESVRQRIQVRRGEALADGVSEAAAAIFLENRRPEAQRSPEWIVLQRRAIDLGMKAIADDLGEKKWYMGDTYSLADIAIGCALGYMDLRFPEIDWRTTYPNLAKFEERMEQRPAYKETMPPR